MRKILAAFCPVLLFLSLSCFSQQNRITVNAAVVKNRIPATLYGSCMEDVNHEIYGGLYDQKIVGESFEEPASGIDYRVWKKAGGYWARDTEYGDSSISIIPGRHTRRMIANNDIDVEPDESAKLLYDAAVDNGTIEGDLKFLQERRDGAGFIIRASDVGIGANSFTGYEIRIDRSDNKLKLIRHHNNFELLAEKETPFNHDGWNHLKISFLEARIKIYINDNPGAAIDFTDSLPLLHGQFGLATAGSPTSFRNIRLSDNHGTIKLPLVYGAGKQVSDRWDIINDGSVKSAFCLLQQNAFNGQATQSVELINGNGRAGVANRSLNRWCIAAEKNQRFTGAVYLRSEHNNMPVTIALESVDGKTLYAKQTLKVNNAEWKKYNFELTPNQTDSNTRFSIYIEQPGKIYIDQASMFATGSKQYKGLPLRADIGNALVAEGLTFMRYAGSMVNAHGYRFKKMIGNRDARPPYTGHWNEYSTDGFGIEEFLQFAEASNITPLFAINIEETSEDMADMVEYLNGDETTQWGSQRAANGHPKPYGVKYIEIGNEEVMFEGDDPKMHAHYVERFNKLFNAMHAKDSSLKLFISVWWRPESANTAATFKALDGKAAYWDYHVGADDKDNGLTLDKELTRMDSLFHTWNPNTTMKCAILEENGGLHNMQRALGHATNLNAVRRHGDFVMTTVPANALQPYLQNDNGWDQGQIFFTPTQVWGMPPFYIQQMAAANHLPLRVQDTTEGKLNVTATRSEDGKTLVLHIVNTDAAAQACTIAINQFAKPKKQAKVFTLSAGLNEQNTPAVPEAVSTKTSVITVNDPAAIQYQFAPYSYTILRFER